jgi:hypothetical protein
MVQIRSHVIERSLNYIEEQIHIQLIGTNTKIKALLVSRISRNLFDIITMLLMVMKLTPGPYIGPELWLETDSLVSRLRAVGANGTLVRPSGDADTERFRFNDRIANGLASWIWRVPDVNSAKICLYATNVSKMQCKNGYILTDSTKLKA